MYKRIMVIGLVALMMATAATARVPSESSLPPSLPNRVASGDTTPTSTVLWARSTVPGPVLFEYGTDPAFWSFAGTSVAAVTDALLPVKVAVNNLTPGTQYYYRATDAAGNGSTGRFRTAPAQGALSGLRFGVSGDWRGELSPYPAVGNADKRNLDFFVELGDTIYADYESPVLPGVAVATTLNDYRLKHTEVYSTRLGLNTLGDLRASTSVLGVIDDHEVINDFAGGAPSSTDGRFPAGFDFINDTPRYEIGMQAFQEFNPLRDEFYDATGDPRTAEERKLYRFNTYGRSAATFVLDARSFRDQGLPPVTDPTSRTLVMQYLAASFDPDRTMLGLQQLVDVQRDLLAADRAGVIWKFVLVPEPVQNVGVVGASDRFEGYAAERTALLKFITANNIRNVVFVAADIHGTLINNLTYQEGPNQPQIATDAFEITTGSVAFEKPFGPTVMEAAHNAGLISDPEYNYYLNAPREQKDSILQFVLNDQLADYNYSLVGLNDAPQINATLVAGSYVAVHTYGWTEFEIDAATQQLTVTTYGIDWYGTNDLATNPAGVIARQPTVVSKFTVTPKSLQQRVYLPLILR